MSEPYRFATLGPFLVPRKKGVDGREIDFSCATAQVFDAAEDQANRKLEISDIRNAIGCYVFALKPPGGQVIWPYYVGQACKQTLAKRLFQRSDKPKKYNEILQEYNRAAAYVYLLPLITPSGRLAKLGTNQRFMDQAEFALIGMALRVNRNLWNVKHRSGMESFGIDGTPQSTRRRDTDAALSFRRMLGFATRPKSIGRVPGELEPIPQDVADLPAEQSSTEEDRQELPVQDAA